MSDDQPSADHPTISITCVHGQSFQLLRQSFTRHDSACMQEARSHEHLKCTPKDTKHTEKPAQPRLSPHIFNAPSHFWPFCRRSRPSSFSSFFLALFCVLPSKAKSLAFALLSQRGLISCAIIFHQRWCRSCSFNSIQSIVATIAKDYHQTPSSTFFITSLVSSSPSVGRKITRRNKKLSPTAQVKI